MPILNGKVVPIEEEPTEELYKQNLSNENSKVVNGSNNLKSDLREDQENSSQKSEDEKELESEKKTDGPKLKPFEIVFLIFSTIKHFIIHFFSTP